MDIKEFLRAFAEWQESQVDASTANAFVNYVSALESGIRYQDRNAESARLWAQDARTLLRFANKLREVSLE